MGDADGSRVGDIIFIWVRRDVHRVSSFKDFTRRQMDWTPESVIWLEAELTPTGYVGAAPSAG